MSKRKVFAHRDKSGKSQRPPGVTPLLAPTKIRRLLDSAAAKVTDPLFATAPGRLFLNGKLSAEQLSAAKYWTQVTENYSFACRSPSPPRSLTLDAIRDMPVDPDNEQGAREAAWHVEVTSAWLAGRDTLRLAGREAEAAVENICIRGLAPTGWCELAALQLGLAALSDLWSPRRKAVAR